MRFEPSGFTPNSDIPIAKSIVDYVFRWLALRYLPEDERPATPAGAVNGSEIEPESNGGNGQDLQARERAVFAAQADAPPCHDCGAIMVRNGACYACANCGATSGCS